jgi:EAL domain-containing protein (putative c-di-GMP-specific phosphodiesterase class I)
VTSALLERLLLPGALSARFQPIYDVGGAQPVIDSVECLLRGPRGTSLEAPDLLFEFARLKRAEAEMDRAAILRLVGEASLLAAPQPHLHVNVHASTLGRDEGFVDFLVAAARAAGLAPRALTLELVEQADFIDERAFVAALARLRGAGLGIALDDVGLGTSNFRMMLVARPDVLKVDRYLIDGIAADPARRAVLASIVGLAAHLGARVVAEGVETPADLDAVRELGVNLVQGYLLSKPVGRKELAGLLATALASGASGSAAA